MGKKPHPLFAVHSVLFVSAFFPKIFPHSLAPLQSDGTDWSFQTALVTCTVSYSHCSHLVCTGHNWNGDWSPQCHSYKKPVATGNILSLWISCWKCPSTINQILNSWLWDSSPVGTSHVATSALLSQPQQYCHHLRWHRRLLLFWRKRTWLQLFTHLWHLSQITAIQHIWP